MLFMVMVMVEHISNSLNVDPPAPIDRPRKLLRERDDDVIVLKPETESFTWPPGCKLKFLKGCGILTIHQSSTAEASRAKTEEALLPSMYIIITSTFPQNFGRRPLRSYSTFKLDGQPDS